MAEVCVNCAARGVTCCQMPDGSPENCFPLSEAEKKRISAAIGRDDFWTDLDNSPEFQALLEGVFQADQSRIARRWPIGGQHSYLATNERGDCVLLGPDGCTVPPESRPHYCRLYPFWVYAGQLTYFRDQSCLAVRTCPSLAALTRLFNVNNKEIMDIYARLCHDWGLDVL